MIISANAFVGELGWELFCWQGYLRQLARDGHDLFVQCLQPHALLYGDFARGLRLMERTILNHVQQDDFNMYMCPPHTLTPIATIGEWPDRFDRIIRASAYRTRWWLENPMPQQAFVPLDLKAVALKWRYDVLLHIRNRHMTAYKTEFRNWPLDHAQQVTDRLLACGYTVACIGLSFSAGCTAGAADCRDVDLYELSALMSTAKVQIGPQSGPTHFAALCRLPQVSWQTKEEHAERVRKYWNPFNTQTITNTAPGDSYWRNYKLWLPKVDWIVDSAKQIIDERREQ